MRQKTRNVQHFILRNVSEHPRSIVAKTALEFGITRQSASRHVAQLVRSGQLSATGHTKGRAYKLEPYQEATTNLTIDDSLAEDRVWREWLAPKLKDIPGNVLDICHYGFTEMVNNVIDHSEGDTLSLGFTYSAREIELIVIDNGVGIFNKIQKAFDLDDPHHALLELAKGKLTTDPKNHTGEGIFFSSRMFDEFAIRSSELLFTREDNEDWLLDRASDITGTIIIMNIDPESTRIDRDVYDEFTSEHEDFGFTRTRIHVKLAQYEGERLVSRSQAKRLLARFEQFKEVYLDFGGIESIGQAFADEIFRVFSNNHPDVQIYYGETTPDVERMIQRALSVKG